MKRIQRKRTKGWKMPPNAVYVGRPTKWGNPFTGKNAVHNFELMILSKLSKDNGDFKNKLRELKGKDLACWCPLNRACHADVLIKYVNQL